jgi:hypothetical protein
MAKFQKGRSGNPRGLPRGVQTQAKLRESIATDLPAIIQGLVHAAKNGDTAAAKLLLDRALPSLRPVDQPAPVPISEDLGAAGRDILAAAGEGKLTPDAGSKILGAVGALAKIIETGELIERVERLERTDRNRSE